MRATAVVALLAGLSWITPAQTVNVVPMMSHQTAQRVTGFGFDPTETTLYAVNKGNEFLKYDMTLGGTLIQTVPNVISTQGHHHLHGMDTTPTGEIWVVDMMQGIFLLDAQLNIVRQLPSPAPKPYSVALDGSTLWIGLHSEGNQTSIYGIDPMNGAVMTVLSPGVYDVHSIVPWEGDLLVLDNLVDRILRIDVAGNVLSSMPLPYGSWYGLTHASSGWWMIGNTGFQMVEFVELRQDPLMAGQPASLRLGFVDSGEVASFAVSLTGVIPAAGPFQSLPGIALLDLVVLGSVPADASGVATLNVVVPAWTAGMTVWTQAASLTMPMLVSAPIQATILP